MDVTALKVSVTSDGIKATNAELDKFVKLADAAEKSNTNLTQSTDKVAKTQKSAMAEAQKEALKMNKTLDAQAAAYSKAQGRAMEMNKAMDTRAYAAVHGEALKLNKAMDAQASAYAKAQAAAMKMNASMDAKAYSSAHAEALKMNKALDDKARALENVHNKGSIWNNTLKSMAVAASAYLGINFAKSIIADADAWLMMQARLKLATGSMQLAAYAQEDLFNLAQKLRVPLADVTQLYTRMSLPLQEMGKSMSDVLQMTEGVSLALKINGSTAAESASVMLQFSQSMAAGRLNGAEFNAVAEGARPILSALVAELKAMGKEVDLGTLKKMGADGAISVELMEAAIKRALPKWRQDFESLPLTVDGAMTRVKNSWLKAIGEMGEDTQLSAKLSASLATIEKSLPEIVAGLAQAVGPLTTILTSLIENFKGIVFVLGTLVAVKLATWAYEAAAAMNILNLAMAKNPVLLAITAITTAVGAGYMAWKLWGEQTEAAATGGGKAVKAGSEMTFAALVKSNDIREKELELIREKKRLEGTPADVASYKTSIELQKEELQLVLARKGAYANLPDVAIGAHTLRLQKEIYRGTQLQIEEDANKTEKALENLKKESKAWDDANKTKVMKREDEIKAIEKFKVDAVDYAKKLAIIEEKYKTGDKALKALTKEQQQYAAGMEKLTATQQEYLQAFDQAMTGDDKRLKAQKELNIAQVHYNATVSDTTKRFSAQDKELAKNALTMATQNVVYAEAMQTMEAYNKALEDGNAAAMKHQDIVLKDIDKIQETNQKLKDQIATFGMTEGAIQSLMVAREESLLLSMKENGASTVALWNQQQIIDGLKEQAALRGTLQGKELNKKANDDYLKDWEKTVEKYEDIFAKGFMDLVSTGKGTWKSFTQSLVNTFKTTVADQIYKMFLKPFVIQLVGNVAGMIGGTGVNAAAGGVGGSLLSSLGSSFASTAIGGAISSSMTAFSAGFNGAALAPGLAGPTTAGAGGLMGAGSSTASMLSAAAPYIAAIVSAYAIHKATQGETRSGGQYGYSTSGTDVYNARRGTTMAASGIGAQFVEGPSGGDPYAKEAKAAINATVSGINNVLKAVGSAATVTGFQAGYESSDKGRGGVFAGGSIAGRTFGESGMGDNYAGTLYERTSAQSLSAEDAIKNFATDLKQVTIQALQAATDIPKSVKDIVDNIDAESLTSEAADSLIKQIDELVMSVNSFKEAIAGLPMENLKAMTFDATDALIKAAGGLSALSNNVNSYYNNFYDAADKTAAQTAVVAEAFSAMNEEVPKTRAAFREMVEGLDLNTESGRAAYVSLISVSEAFAAVTPAAEGASVEIEAITRSLEDIRNEAQSLQDQYDSLTMTSVELRAKERLSIDASNYSLFDAITAQTDMKEAVEAANEVSVKAAEEAIKASEAAAEATRELAAQTEAYAQAARDAENAVVSAIDSFRGAQKSVADNLRSLGDMVEGFAEKVASTTLAVASVRSKITEAYVSAQNKVAAAQENVTNIYEESTKAMKGFGKSISEFLDSLKTTTTGSGNPLSQLEALREQFVSTAEAARGGDVDAQGKLLGISQSFLEASKAYNATGAGFISDEAMVKSALTGIQTLAASGGISIKTSPEMDIANAALQKAQEELVKYAQLANETGSDTNYLVSEVDRNISSLLDEFTSATAAQREAQANYAEALILTRGLALTTTNAMTGLKAGVDAYNASIVTLAEAARALAAATLARAAANTNLPTYNTATLTAPPYVPTNVTYTPSGTERDYTNGQFVGPQIPASPAEAFVESLYTNIAGRASDAAGKAWWVGKITSGMSFMEAQSEFQTVIDRSRLDGSHRNGLNSVPFDGYVSELHAGERVLTSAEAASSDELVDLNRQLLAQLEKVSSNTGAVITQNTAIAEMNAELMQKMAAAQEKTVRKLEKLPA